MGKRRDPPAGRYSERFASRYARLLYDRCLTVRVPVGGEQLYQAEVGWPERP